MTGRLDPIHLTRTTYIMAKKTEQIAIIDRAALRTLKAEVEKELEALAKKYGVAFECAKGHFSNGDTGDFTLNIVVAKGKDGKSAADILAADAWNLYAKSFGLDPKLLGTTFEYKGHTCTIKGITPSRRKYPVQVDMGGKSKLFPVDIVNLHTDPKRLKAHQKLTAGWQKPNARMRGRV
jgi:hypothetical protein